MLKRPGVFSLRGSSSTPPHTSTKAKSVPMLVKSRMKFSSVKKMGMPTTRPVTTVLKAGVATSATLMVPCPWALDGLEQARGFDIGVHLTFTAEYPTYRWRPLTGAKSLCDEQGYMPAEPATVWARADLAEVAAECRAQIDQALAWGLDPTHLDAHMGTMQIEPRYFALFVDLAVEYRLPLRMFGAGAERRFRPPAFAEQVCAG